MKNLLCTLLLLFTMFTVHSQTMIDGIYYDFDYSTKTATVTAGSSELSGNVTIPSMVLYEGDSYSVTGIGDFAFQMNTSLTSIDIPISVINIGEYAFRGCSSLTSIELPENLTCISRYCFLLCKSLTSVTIPNSVTSIEGNAFANCSSLTNVHLSTNLKKIDYGAFYMCTNLVSIEIPNGVTIIGDGTFYHCESLPSINLPNSLTSIGESAFSGCTSFTSITIPNSVLSIGFGAFIGCTGLTTFTIPYSVTSIDGSLFYGCTKLKSIIVDSKNSKYDSRDNCNAIIETASNKLVSGCKNTIIPNSVEIIGRYAFCAMPDLTSIRIPNSVKIIESSAFSDCTDLTSIRLPESLTRIDAGAFESCTGLTSVTIPSNVIDVGYGAFKDCSNLKSVTIKSNAFLSKSHPYETFDDQFISLTMGYFFGNQVEEYVIGDEVYKIAEKAFENCSNLKSVTLGVNVTEIGEGVFKNCSQLTTVTVKNTKPVIIDESAFSNRFNAILYVPARTKASYLAANYWKDFKDIIEMDLNQLATPDPSTFQATDITETGFIASWGIVEGALYYDILVKHEGGTYEHPDYNGGCMSTSIKVTDLEPGTSYYFQIRARNDNYNERSNWSPSISQSVRTAEAGSTPVQLNIINYSGFDGNDHFVVGKSYIYNVKIGNNASSTWRGNLCLKESGDVIKEWTDVILPQNTAKPFGCYYSPKSEGTRDIVLYYRTEGTESYIPVKYDNAPNSLIVYISSPEEVINANLSLKEAIDCPETVYMNATTSIVAKVQNNNDKDWTGTLYLTDGKNPLISKHTTIKSGRIYTLSFPEWVPTTDGVHPISVYYRTDEDLNITLVLSNGFDNPLSVEVVNNNEIVPVTNAVLTLITRNCAPHELNGGDKVFYHYRVTDAEGNPLSGVKAHFTCRGTTKREFVETTPSDIEGYAILGLDTEGDDAFAERGETVTFNCTGFIDSEQNWIDLRNGNSVDCEFTLKYRESNKFSRAVGFDNVESFGFTLNRGIDGSAVFGDLISASASLSFPLTTTLKWDDGKFLTIMSSEAKAEGEVGLDTKCFDGNLNIHAGIKENTTYNWNKPGRTALAITLGWLGGLQFFTSSKALLAVEALESWAGVKKGEGYFAPIIEDGPNITSYWGFTPRVKTEFKFIQSWPTKFNIGLGTLFPQLEQTISFKENSYKFGLDASFKMDPDVTKFGINKTILYGSNRALNVKASGNFARLAGNVSPAKLTIWGPVGTIVRKFDDMFYNVINNHNFSNWGSGLNFNLSVEEEEMYTTPNRTTIEEVSHNMSIGAALELSTDKLMEYITPEWLNIEGETLSEGIGKYGFSFGAGMKWNWKMSSKGAWAKHLHNLAKSTEGRYYIRNLFPVFGDEYLIQAPITYLKMLTDDYDMKDALAFAASKSSGSYGIEEAFKIEQQETENVEFMANVPIANFWPFYLTVDLGFKLDFKHYPSVTYYSVADKRFFPVILRSCNPAAEMAKNATSFMHNEISNLFSDKDKEELNEEYEKVGQKFETITVPDASTLLSNVNSKHYINSKAQRIRNKHPMLVQQKQKDICTFTFVLNEQEPNFNDSTHVEFSHIYPAGCLLGLTEQNDTLFVLSEVCNIYAIQGADTLQTTQQGKMRLETTVGADDLTPFGFSETYPLDVYYSNDGGEIWQYVGPAGSSLKVDEFGSYMLGTSIKNDVLSPQIAVDLNEETGIVHINISDNIGVRLNTLQILVNGEYREALMINRSNFEFQLSSEEMQYMITLFITIVDLAGNQGSTFLVLNLDKPDNIDSPEIQNESKTTISLNKRMLKVEGAKPNTIVTVFTLDGFVQTKAKTNTDGLVQINLDGLLDGIYIVTTSDGKSKKFIVK